jgi:hypothetical protein
MLICTNCLSEQHQPHATTCAVCRMPRRLKYIPNPSSKIMVANPATSLTESHTCKNCLCVVPWSRVPLSHCPECRIPLPVPVSERLTTLLPVQKEGVLGEAKSDSLPIRVAQN